jgi:5-methyltetrahydropteroyltriglutamate--homocysteine methyltransferase
MADDFRYHIDHHGSLVRPPELLAARAGGDPLGWRPPRSRR